MAAYQDASELRGKTLTLVNSSGCEFAHRTTWLVLNVSKTTGNLPSLSLRAVTSGKYMSVMWPKLREWIAEGYIDVS